MLRNCVRSALFFITILFLVAGSNVARAFDPEYNGKARFFSRNDERWFAHYTLTKMAHRNIDATYFILGSDPFGLAWLGQLLEAQKSGTHVRLMLDARGTKGLIRMFRGADLIQELVNAGAEVRVFNPMFAKGLTRHMITSNHDKILIIDDRYVKTGGSNLDGNYLLNEVDRPESYFDADVVVDSVEAAKKARIAFEREFQSARAYKVSKDIFGNVNKRVDYLKAALAIVEFRMMNKDNSLIEKFVKYMPLTWRKKFRELPKWLGMYGIDHFELFDPKHTHDVQITPLDNTSLFTNQSLDGAQEITREFHKLIDAEPAGGMIFIQNPYVVLTEKTYEKLKAAGARGVRIIFSTNGPTSTDSILPQSIITVEWDKMLSEIQNSEIWMDKGPRKQHAKVTVFKSQNKSFVASFNMDYLSDRVNSEFGLIIESQSFAETVLRELNEHKESFALQLSLSPVVGPWDIPGSRFKMAVLKCTYYLLSRWIRPTI